MLVPGHVRHAEGSHQRSLTFNYSCQISFYCFCNAGGLSRTFWLCPFWNKVKIYHL